jgi:hypothetical protein
MFGEHLLSFLPLSAPRGEREGPIAKRWEGEVGMLSDSPTSPQPSPPPRAERGKKFP